MKTIIAGSRTLQDAAFVEKAIEDSGFEITEVVCGMANGVDMIGAVWAMKNKIPVKKFPAHWDEFGKAAGPIRNAQMGDYAEALIAVTHAGSHGTNHMIEYATKKGLKVFVVKW